MRYGTAESLEAVSAFEVVFRMHIRITVPTKLPEEAGCLNETGWKAGGAVRLLSLIQFDTGPCAAARVHRLPSIFRQLIVF